MKVDWDEAIETLRKGRLNNSAVLYGTYLEQENAIKAFQEGKRLEAEVTKLMRSMEEAIPRLTTEIHELKKKLAEKEG